jgi:hypothetical protein
MARNGSGTYALPAGNPVETNTVISSVVQNNSMTDIATALTGSIARDGQSPATANIPMGNNKLTGLATPTTRTDATSLGSIVDGVGVYGATVGGTGNAITVTLAPVLTAYVAGQKFSFIASAANTGAVTVDLNSVGAKAITKVGTTALVANDILSGSLVEVEYDGTRFQLLSPIGADPTGTYLPLAGGTLTGDLNMSAKAINTAVHTEAAHATTSDIWTGGNTCLLSGSVVTFTDVADAPAVGAVREVIANAAHVITDNAALEVDGNANYTCAVGDLLRFEAKTTSTFRVSVVAHGDGGGSGDAKTANPLSQFAATTSAQLAGVISNETGSGLLVFNDSPTLITPALGTPASGVATNLTGTAASLTSGNVTTNANLTGHVTSSGNAAVLGSFTSAQLATALTNETGSGLAVFGTSPTLITPVLGTPSSGTVTNLTGTASININGTVGASTPAAATATTLNTTGAVVFNDAGADVDFRVEGDTDPFLIFADGGVDRVQIGGSDGSLYNGAATNSKLTVIGSSNNTNIVQNGGAAIAIVNTDQTDENTAGLHFARADTDDTPNYAGASIVAQFKETQATGLYPSATLNFLTSPSQNAAPTLKMTLTEAGRLGIGIAAPAYPLDVYGVAAIKSGESLTWKGGAQLSAAITGEGATPVLKFWTSVNERMRIDADGNLYVNTTAGTGGEKMALWYSSNTGPAFSIRDTDAQNGNTFLQFHNGTTVAGLITSNGTSTISYGTSSDYRLKENVEYDWDATTRLKQLKPARFNFITNPDTTVDGFIAHEAQEVVPESVTGVKDEVDDEDKPVMQGIDQSKLVPLLVKTIQELEARITALEAR